MRKKEYISPISGVLVVIPKQGLHFTDLKKAIDEAGLHASRITESCCMVNVPCGKETKYMKMIERLPFVSEVQRHFHFDPPN
ncbi:MAG: hypothetical protein HZA36_01250 [Parcubacteria group bacterium]|nr:hypothetical protein [Parcubacteria group bacterium]